MTKVTENLMDLCLMSEGVITYSEAKQMSARELEIVSTRMAKFAEKRAQAMKSKTP